MTANSIDRLPPPTPPVRRSYCGHRVQEEEDVFGLSGTFDIEIKMLGRWAVWPTMFSLFLAMVSVTWVAEALLYFGLALTLVVTVQYVRDYVQLLQRPSSSG